MELDNGQLTRLMWVLELQNTIIERGTIDSTEGGWLKFDFIDTKRDIKCHGEKYFAKHSEEDMQKVDFILNGFKLEREE